MLVYPIRGRKGEGEVRKVWKAYLRGQRHVVCQSRVISDTTFAINGEEKLV